jgi:hypothetical protein
MIKSEIMKRGRKGKKGEAKMVLCHLGNRELGISGKELSEYLGITKGAVTQNIDKGERIVKERDLNLMTMS